ncbi:MAG: hypothetical protein JXB03_07780 [Spirochaetales bacterium]|nr:hypothetical protein [Spirochaetales bacterium]
MKNRVRLATALFVFLQAVILPLYAEMPVGRGTVSASMESIQRYISYSTPLNPGNIFGADEGYLSSFRYTFGYQTGGEHFSFTLNDYGSFSTDDISDGRNCLGELFGTIRLNEVFIDAGKKRINQSPSYFLSPINFVLDDYSEYELRYSEGRVMLNLEWFSPLGFIGFSYLPRLKVSGDIERYVTSPQEQQVLARYEVSGTAGTLGLAVSLDERWRVGAHVSRSLGQYAEAHVEMVWDEDEKMKNVSGITVNLPQVTIITEYYYNQAGCSRSEWKREQDRFQQLVNTEPLEGMALYGLGTAFEGFVVNRGNTGRHYTMLRVSNPTADNWELSLAATMNLQDSGMLIMPAIGYSGWHNLVMAARFLRCVGTVWSEYALYGHEWSCELSLELWI